MRPALQLCQPAIPTAKGLGGGHPVGTAHPSPPPPERGSPDWRCQVPPCALWLVPPPPSVSPSGRTASPRPRARGHSWLAWGWQSWGSFFLHRGPCLGGTLVSLELVRGLLFLCVCLKVSGLEGPPPTSGAGSPVPGVAGGSAPSQRAGCSRTALRCPALAQAEAGTVAQVPPPSLLLQRL